LLFQIQLARLESLLDDAKLVLQLVLRVLERSTPPANSI